MTYRLLPKRDLSLDSTLMGGSNVHGSRSEVQGPKSKAKRISIHRPLSFTFPALSNSRCFCFSRSLFTVHCSLFMVHGSRPNENGFTLIEVIAALIIIAVLAAMVFPVTSSGLWRTARGVGECQELFELQGQMEEIVEVYKTQLSGGNGVIDLEDFRDSVLGYSYVDSGSTGFLEESGNNLTLTATPTSVLLITLTAGDQRIASIFSK